MGTRGLLGHIIRGKKKAMYNHFDSYPDGLGVELAKFINSLTEEQIEEMKKRVDELEWVKEMDPPPVHFQELYTDRGFLDLGVGLQRVDNWYCLLRHVQGAAALPHILDGSLVHQIDNSSFEEDTLFCEWVYWVDWEKREVQVASGKGARWVVGFAEISAEWMEGLRVGSDEDETRLCQW